MFHIHPKPYKKKTYDAKIANVTKKGPLLTWLHENLVENILRLFLPPLPHPHNHEHDSTHLYPQKSKKAVLGILLYILYFFDLQHSLS